jgi:hypothetical protein
MTDVVFLVELGNSPTTTRRTNDERREQSARDSQGQCRVSPSLSESSERVDRTNVSSVTRTGGFHSKWPGRVFIVSNDRRTERRRTARVLRRRTVLEGSSSLRDDVRATGKSAFLPVTFIREVQHGSK